MAPIHDTDIAEKRWDEGEWQYYELWEKIEHRLRRRKWLWIAATFVVFILISAVPVLTARWGKWEGMILSRRLAQAIGQMKLEAARTRSAMRITFPADGALTYLIETAPACASTSWQKVREGGLASSDRQAGKFRMVSGGDGQRLGISGLTQSLCYDSLLGAGVTEFRAFAILPVNDLALGDDRRASVLLVEGPSAEMSFE